MSKYSLVIVRHSNLQGMSCEGACAHAHVRSAVARVRVRAKSILESVRDVRACGPFLGVRCAITLLHTFCLKNQYRIRMSYPILEHPFLLWNILSCFRSPFSVLEHLILFQNTLNHKNVEKLQKNVEKLLKKVGNFDEKRQKNC